MCHVKCAPGFSLPAISNCTRRLRQRGCARLRWPPFDNHYVIESYDVITSRSGPQRILNDPGKDPYKVFKRIFLRFFKDPRRILEDPDKDPCKIFKRIFVRFFKDPHEIVEDLEGSLQRSLQESLQGSL